MKRTPAALPDASTSARMTILVRLRPWFLASGALLLMTLAFMGGRHSVEAPPALLKQVELMRQEIQLQQRAVDRLRVDNSNNVKALAARLAELQAASSRLDALGERLANMGQLSLDEFDFSQQPPVGGPFETTGNSFTGKPELTAAIDLLSEKLRKQSTQLDALQFLMVNRQLESDLTPAGWPVRKGWISSRYGERTDPFTGERVQHRGLDFAGTRGTEVLSMASGVVTWSGSRSAYGKTVEVDHGNGYQTRYAHCDELLVEVGDRVIQGQVIAKMGMTGRASAPHVHFEVLKNGARIDPARFVRK